MVWDEHKNLLGDLFYDTPHVFLASRFAGDVEALLDRGADPDRVWAVECDDSTWESLLQDQAARGFRLFTNKIQVVMESREAAKHDIRSVYLDFCGHLRGRGVRDAIRRALRQLPEGSVVSITLLRGREHGGLYNRQKELVRLVRKHVRVETATLTQEIHYTSKDSSGKGSPMSTWTFYLGGHPGKQTRRYNLGDGSDEDRQMEDQQMEEQMKMKETETKARKRSEAARKAWVTRRKKARKRSEAARKAWVTRRKKAGKRSG